MDAAQKYFISFNSADEQKADWIAWTLDQAGHEVAIHTWEIPAGGDIPRWMNNRLAWADRLIAVVSPDYLAGTYSVSEWTAMVWQDADGSAGAVVPVLVRPTPDLPPMLAKLSRIDLTGLGEAEARRRLLEGLEAPAPPRHKPGFDPVPPAEGNRGPKAKPAFSHDAFVQDARVDAIAGSSGAAAGVLGELVRRITEGDPLAASEKTMLKRIIRDLGILHHGQSGVVDRLRRAVDERDAGNWRAVQDAVARVGTKVSELVAFLERFEGDIIYKDRETFSKLQSMTMTRAGIYAELQGMPPPQTEEGWERLATMVGRIEALLRQIDAVQEGLSEYLASDG